MNDHTLNHRDPDSDAIIEQLDALGSHERSIPDAGFEQRLMGSISEQIAPAPLPMRTAESPKARFTLGWKLNIAAAIVVVAGASMLIWTSSQSASLPVSQSPQQMLVSLEDDFDALFELPDFTDTIDSDMDELDLMTDEVHTELSLPNLLMEISDSSLTEGSL